MAVKQFENNCLCTQLHLLYLFYFYYGIYLTFSVATKRFCCHRKTKKKPDPNPKNRVAAPDSPNCVPDHNS